MLNVGLSAGILDTRTFSMFVLHALILTFMTTPLTILIYPSRFYVHLGTSDQSRLAEIEGGYMTSSSSAEKLRTRFTVVLDRIEQLPAVMTVTQMLQPPVAPMHAITATATSSINDEKAFLDASPPGLVPHAASPSTNLRISVNAVRLIELTDRTSAVLKSQTVETLIHSDPALAVLRTFGFLNHMNISTALSVISYEEFSSHITTSARSAGSQMVIVPWNLTSPADENQGAISSSMYGGALDTLFPTRRDENASFVHSQYVRKVFAETQSDVALFVDRESAQFEAGVGRHLFLPFFGGPDDRLALSLVVQICMNPANSATVIRMKKSTDEATYNPADAGKGPKPPSPQDSRHIVRAV